MVGGGLGAFIGPVHRMAATMDGEAEFVAGAFSSDPKKSAETGKALYLDSSRVYGDYKEMAQQEAALPADQRIDFVSIVTPNVTHFDVAKTFLEAGFHVICDKPMTFTLEQAKELEGVVNGSGRVFVLTHNYTGYPMVKQAKEMVKAGTLGTINKVVVEYPQGWLSHLLHTHDASELPWRLDPNRAGISSCMGDIGTHAENLTRYITGLEIEEVCADLSSFIPANKLDDDGNVLLHFKGGARGILYASQISAGEENGLRIRVYGDKAGLEWRQEDPNYLWIKDPAGLITRYSKGNDNLTQVAQDAGRLPFGHPDGFIEAFANIYLAGYEAIRAVDAGKAKPNADHPTVHDGVVGMAFISTVVESSKNRQWTSMKL
jgi:predicted dehydrogenase